MLLRIKREVEVEPSVSELAEAFSLLCDDERAEFFNCVSKEFDKFGRGIASFKRYMIAMNRGLSNDAKFWICSLARAIAEDE
jgi:hypothetical protein